MSFLLVSSNDFVWCKSNYLLPQVVQLNCNPHSSSECPITGGHLNRMVTFVLVVLSELNYYWEKICNFELRSSVLNWQREKISRKNLKIVWNLGKILLPKNSKILKANYFPNVVVMSITTKDKICRFDFKSPLAGRSLQNFLPRLSWKLHVSNNERQNLQDWLRISPGW